ncbi:MAG: class I SAM-dependent methyltransferase [Pseudooceanicola atlanticus]
MAGRNDLMALAARTRDIYQRNAERFDAERAKHLIEAPWLDRMFALLGPAPRVLDLGCGAGEPIARALIERGARVAGLDIAPAMLALARDRMPEAEWIEGDMRSLALERQFDAIIGWHSFFHLTADDQRRTLPRLAAHLAPGGALLLTVGPEAGEEVGRVGDDPIYHASLAPEEYRAILESQGISIRSFTVEDPTCDGATILLAQKNR